MKLYVIVRNEVAYHHFFEKQHEAFGYLFRTLPEKLKGDLRLKNVKTYIRHQRLYVQYNTIMLETRQKDMYSIEEISQINVLNWLAEAKENKWIRHYLEAELAAQAQSAEE